MKPSDYIAAAIPPISAVSVASVNEVAGLIGTLLGIFYIAWKWQNEVKKK